MINKILFNSNGTDIEIISKIKNGKYTYWTLSNGLRITSSLLYNSLVKIECHVCNQLSQIRYYGGKNGLEHRLYLCQSCNKKGSSNPFFGKQHSDELKQYLSAERKGKWNVGDKNPMYGKNAWETLSQDKRNELSLSISLRTKGDKNPFFGERHTAECIKKMSEMAKQRLKDNPDLLVAMIAGSLTKRRYHKTSIEKRVEQELTSREIPHKYNKILHRRYQYDFVIENYILLEVQGDYWHANPIYYGVGKIPLTERQRFKIDQDTIKRSFAEKYGYKIYYIWETEINSGSFCALDEIKSILESHKNVSKI